MTTKRRNTEARQQQILGIARELIVKHGSEHVTIRRIARAAGISEAAIYRHFKSKTEILTLLLRDIEEMWMSEFEEVETPGSALDSLDEALTRRISTAEQKGGVSFQVIAEIISLGDKKLNTQAARIVGLYVDRLAGLLSRGISEGELKPELDASAAATILFGMVQGLVSIWALNGYNFSLTDRYGDLWKTFSQGIGAGSSGATVARWGGSVQ